LNFKIFQKIKSSQQNYFSTILFAICYIAFVKWFFPSAIPLNWFFWRENSASVVQILMSSWPVFTFGIVFTSFVLLITKNNPESNYEAEEKLAEDIFISIYAGVTEEIAFRWILFLSCIPAIQLLDWFCGGFLFGNGLINFTYTKFFIPFADFLTFHQLTQYLYNPLSWSLGAAILSTNGKFRDGHSYQGPIGWLDAWFFGMFMYKIVWECGLPIAIFVHISYNSLIFILKYIDRKVEFHVHKNR
jgi:Type II CAAX prenyl endopeptidase Rce1-like